MAETAHVCVRPEVAGTVRTRVVLRLPYVPTSVGTLRYGDPVVCLCGQTTCRDYVGGGHG